MESNPYKKNFSLANCCASGILVCFILAWAILPTLFGLEAFNDDSKSIKLSFFLAIAPGALIGAIVYYIRKSEEKKKPTDKYEETLKGTVNTDSQPSLSDQLREIKKLHEEGILSEEEFIKLKKEILNNN